MQVSGWQPAAEASAKICVSKSVMMALLLQIAPPLVRELSTSMRNCGRDEGVSGKGTRACWTNSLNQERSAWNSVFRSAEPFLAAILRAYSMEFSMDLEYLMTWHAESSVPHSFCRSNNLASLLCAHLSITAVTLSRLACGRDTVHAVVLYCRPQYVMICDGAMFLSRALGQPRCSRSAWRDLKPAIALVGPCSSVAPPDCRPHNT